MKSPSPFRIGISDSKGAGGVDNAKVFVHRTFNVLTLIVGLGLLVAAQFVLIPFLFTLFVHDPYDTHGSSGGFGRGGGMRPNEYVQSLYDHQLESTKRLRMKRTKNAWKHPLYYADGTFNGVPVFLKKRTNFQSKVHCVGENYKADAWKYRSCRYHMMCFNMSSNEFHIYQSYNERLLSVYMAQRQHMHSSSTMFRYGSKNKQDVSIGGINQKWNDDGIERLRWFPRVVESNRTTEITYYELPPDSVMIPFHSLNGANPGHLVWDDFLPIYTLLRMFQLTDRELVLLRYVLPDTTAELRGLWASCDVRAEKREECRKMMSKFMPLMIGSDARYKFTTTVDYEFVTSGNVVPASDLVCSRTGLAGIGSLTGTRLML